MGHRGRPSPQGPGGFPDGLRSMGAWRTEALHRHGPGFAGRKGRKVAE